MRQDVKIGQLKRQLLEASRQLSVGEGWDEARVEPAADVIDQIQAYEAREFALRGIDRRTRQYREIQQALQRIDQPDYGLCVDCEEEISARRLQAVPWAQRCVKCQERHETATSPETTDEEMAMAHGA